MAQPALQTVEYSKHTFKNASKLCVNRDSNENDPLRYVQVKDRVANFCNGHALLRRYCDAPDGLYTIGGDGELNIAQVPQKLFFKFPNYEIVRPPLETMKPHCEVIKDIRGQIISFCHAVSSVDGHVVVNKDSMWMKQDISRGISYNFNLPNPVTLNPKYLEIVLIEMLQYPVFYLLMEDSSIEAKPLVIGCNWENCAIVMPLRD